MAKDNVDERVVQLMLDSKEFDSNAKKSIQSLDDLKKALEFEGASKGFDAIERAARKVDFSIMDNGIQKVQDHFNLLNTVATTVIERITNSAIDSGTRMVKALSVDQISQGWSQFEERTTAMQRIMSATSQQFANEEEQIAAVNEQMEKLVWFTDETSYKYLDIVNSIGKFTANNVDLKESVKAMEGISTWASLSGASIEESGRAMYNLAQAMSVGAVKLQDWKSIENANMATYEFKQTAIDTAVAVGTLTQDMYGYYHAGDKAFAATELFSEGLKQGWFNAEVLMETLSKYGGFTDLLNEFMNAVEKEGFYTASALNIIDDYVDGHLDLKDAMYKTAMSAEELTGWLEKLGSEEMELGRKGFKAAQETKTLSEAIDYIKTAVSSGWAQSFQYIFGDYNEAKEWWSEVSEALYSVFVESGEARNELLAFWKEAGGRDTLLDGIRTLAKNIKGILDSISGAWDNIFGRDDIQDRVNDLINLTDKFKAFAESITFTDSTFQDFLRILESIFRTFKTIGRVVATVMRSLEPFGRVLNKLAGYALNLVANFAEMASINLEMFFNDQKLQAMYDVLSFIVTLVAYLTSGALKTLFSGFQTLVDVIGQLMMSFNTSIGGVDNVVATLISHIQEIWVAFLDGDTIIEKVSVIITALLGAIVSGVQLVINTIRKLFKGEIIDFDETYGNVVPYFQKIIDFFENSSLNGIFETMGAIIMTAVGYIRDLFIELNTADSAIRQLLGSLQVELAGLYEWFKGLFADLSAGDIAAIAFVVSLSLLIMELKKAVTATTGLKKSVGGLVGTLNEILKTNFISSGSQFMKGLEGIFNKTKILQIGLSVTMLVAALNELNKLDIERTMQSIITIGASMGLLLGVMKAYAKIKESMPEKKEGDSKLALYILEISAGIFLLSKALSTLTAALNGEDAVKKMSAAVATIGLLGAAMTVMVQKLSKMNTKDLAGAAVSMLAMGGAISLLVTPLRVIAVMKMEEALQGCLGVIGMLVAMGMAARLMQEVDWKNLIALGVSMPMIAGAMLMLSAAVYAMNMALSSENGWAGLGTIAAGIVVFAVALSMLAGSASVVDAPSLLAMSAAIVAFGLAITFMSTGLVMLSTIEWQKVVGYLLLFTGAISALFAVATLCTAATMPLLALAAVIVSFGAAVALFATGIRAFVEAFALMATTITTLGTLADQLGVDLPEAIEKGLDAVYQIISGLLQMIPKLVPDIIVAISSLIAAIIAAFSAGIPAMVGAVLLLGLAICKTIVALGPSFAEALIAAIKILNTYVPEILEQLGVFIELVFEGIGVILRHACIGLVDMCVAALFGKESMDKFKEGQLSTMDGIVEGVEEGEKKYVDTMAKVGKKGGKAFVDNANDEVGVNSPSLEMIKTMLFSALGLEEGADKYLIPTAETVGTETGNTLVEATRETAVSGMTELGGDLAAMRDKMLKDMGLSDVPGLFTLSSSPKGGKDIYAGLSDYERGVAMAEHWTEEEVKQLLASRESKKKETEEKAYDAGFDFGSSVGDSFGKGTSSGAKASVEKKEEKEKTAEEIVDEYISAIEKAYSRGVEQLDFSTQHLNLQDKMWKLTHKEGTTDAEKKAYEAAKKEHELDILDKQMESQLWKINLKQAEYEDKLNTLGSSAVQTQKAYNELLEEQYNILDLYSQKQELMTEESDESADAFIAASKEISSYRELVEKGLITEEMMISAANEKLKAFRHEESDLARKHTTELDNMLGQVIAAFEENGGNLKEAFGTIVTENMIEAFDNVGDNTEGMAASLTDTFANMITVAKDDPKLIAEQKGLGADIVNGTISGMDETKDKFIKNAKVISHDGLDAMADVFDVNSPSKETYKMGVWLDEGLANGLLNDGAVSKVLNAADEIARKLLARLKAKLGVSSPSKETYAIAKWLDVGMANGITNYADIVMKSSDRMVSNLLSNMKSQIDQNGSEMKTYLKDSFGLTDDDLRFTVIVDADTSLADSSLTELERAYAYQNHIMGANAAVTQPTFSGVNRQDSLLAKLNEQETYRATQLQKMYDLVNSYVTEQRSKNFSGEDSGDADSAKTIVNNFNQTNISPKPISALDTYRNTQKQLNTFNAKFRTK